MGLVNFSVADMIADTGEVVSINGNFRAGTPMPITSYLVQGASGGGGNNYTGSSSSFQTFTACIDLNPLPPTQVNTRSFLTFEAEQSIPQMPGGPEVMINPNPASNSITVSFIPAHTGKTKIEIFTMNGRKVFDRDYGICDAENRCISQIDVNKLVNGFYLVRVWNGGRVTNKKIVIAH